MAELVKLVVTVPEDSADTVREAVGAAGGGKIGNYAFCSFSVKGVGRFLPQDGANPSIGIVGQPEQVVEERIEFTCERSQFEEIILALREVHPYEEPAIDLYPLVSL